MCRIKNEMFVEMPIIISTSGQTYVQVHGVVPRAWAHDCSPHFHDLSGGHLTQISCYQLTRPVMARGVETCPPIGCRAHSEPLFESPEALIAAVGFLKIAFHTVDSFPAHEPAVPTTVAY